MVAGELESEDDASAALAQDLLHHVLVHVVESAGSDCAEEVLELKLPTKNMS